MKRSIVLFLVLVMGVVLMACTKSPQQVTCVGIASCYDKAYNICGREWHQVPTEGEAFATVTMHGEHYDMLFVCGN